MNRVTNVLLVLSLLAFLIGVISIHRTMKNFIDEKVRTDVIHQVDTIKSLQPTATDTVYLTKTLTKAIEVPYERIIYREGKVDTLRTFDTLTVDLPMEQRIYRDSDYTAWVSGIDPVLDSINVYRHTTTITKTVKKKPKVTVSIGPYVGYGKGFNYGIGITVGYPIWSR